MGADKMVMGVGGDAGAARCRCQLDCLGKRWGQGGEPSTARAVMGSGMSSSDEWAGWVPAYKAGGCMVRAGASLGRRGEGGGGAARAGSRPSPLGRACGGRMTHSSMKITLRALAKFAGQKRAAGMFRTNNARRQQARQCLLSQRGGAPAPVRQ